MLGWRIVKLYVYPVQNQKTPPGRGYYLNSSSLDQQRWRGELINLAEVRQQPLLRFGITNNVSVRQNCALPALVVPAGPTRQRMLDQLVGFEGPGVGVKVDRLAGVETEVDLYPVGLSISFYIIGGR